MPERMNRGVAMGGRMLASRIPYVGGIAFNSNAPDFRSGFANSDLMRGLHGDRHAAVSDVTTVGGGLLLGPLGAFGGKLAGKGLNKLIDWFQSRYGSGQAPGMGTGTADNYGNGFAAGYLPSWADKGANAQSFRDSIQNIDHQGMGLLGIQPGTDIYDDNGNWVGQQPGAAQDYGPGSAGASGGGGDHAGGGGGGNGGGGGGYSGGGLMQDAADWGMGSAMDSRRNAEQFATHYREG